MASTGRKPRGLFLIGAGSIIASSVLAQWVTNSPVAAAPELGLIVATPYLIFGGLLVLTGSGFLFLGWRAREGWAIARSRAAAYFFVLGALLLWSVLGWTRGKSNAAEMQTIRCLNASKNLYTLLGDYAKEHKGNFPARLEDLCPDYLRQIPLCRISDNDTGVEYRYSPSADRKRYTLDCGRAGHPKTTEGGILEAKQ